MLTPPTEERESKKRCTPTRKQERKGTACRVYGARGFRDLGFGGLGSGFGVWDLGFRVHGYKEFRVQSLGYRIRGLGFKRRLSHAPAAVTFFMLRLRLPSTRDKGKSNLVNKTGTRHQRRVAAVTA
jgi:hypothetical protein